MRILSAHCSYSNPGGEDVVAHVEADLLLRNGHELEMFLRSNTGLTGFAGVKALAGQFLTVGTATEGFLHVLKRFSPHIVHVHNTWFGLPPKIYRLARNSNVPVVQSLHNYRMICPGALLYRGGAPCERCVGKLVPWAGIAYGCYRSSRVLTAAVAGSTSLNRALGMWSQHIDIFVAPTEFSRRRFVAGGMPSEQIVVKPNFVHPDPGWNEGDGDYALFVGRLSVEKGVPTLLAAWRHLAGVPLRLVGSGPLLEESLRLAGAVPSQSVSLLGQRPREDVWGIMKGARFLIFPSECYEGFPMTIAEALACGVPVIASRLGAMAEIVDDGRTGLLFTPGDPEDLAAKVEWAWAHPERMREMGREARREFELKYTAERNYRMLMDIYQLAIERHRAQGS